LSFPSAGRRQQYLLGDQVPLYRHAGEEYPYPSQAAFPGGDSQDKLFLFKPRIENCG